MIIHIVAVLLILGIAYIQMTSGLFSSLIMAVCTIFSAAVAISLYEWLASSTGIYEIQSSVADGVCLAVLFVASLLALRSLADSFIRNDILFDVYVDRICGAILGLFTGTVLIGVILVVMQMVPFGRIVMGDYMPFTDNLLRARRLTPFFPDDFVIGFGRMISSSSMSGERTLDQVHDDLLLESFCARNTAGRHGRGDTEPNMLKTTGDMLGVYELTDENAPSGLRPLEQEIPSNPLLGEDSHTRVLVVRMAVNVRITSDEDDWWRIPATQFRLYCEEGEEGKKTYHSYYPIGYLFYDRDARSWKIALPPEGKDGITETAKLILERPKQAAGYDDVIHGKGKVAEQDINLVMDWVFRIPEDATPLRIFFRRTNVEPLDEVRPEFPYTRLRERALRTKPPKQDRRSRRRRKKSRR